MIKAFLFRNCSLSAKQIIESKNAGNGFVTVSYNKKVVRCADKTVCSFLYSCVFINDTGLTDSSVPYEIRWIIASGHYPDGSILKRKNL